ncbi:hypothetical protein BUALT_Bualt02G0004200 [Buddleja alternifolia]|uniref:Membrane protein of ER body-like protein n=1 Tax=Buddleja alternifolia TaxID=168488 RepID=A0AAV6XXW6_9LAMI|nr:hypothetical protein BUALT_Bualt02G0004200 [Buddleja alternifolia]
MEVIIHHREEVAEEEPQLVERRPGKQLDKITATNGDITTSSSDESSESEMNGSDSKLIGYKNDQELEKNGISGKSVYFDNNEGMWKCHHCIWTYKIGNLWVDHVHHKSFNLDSRGTTLQLSLSDNNLRVEDVVNSIINNQNNIKNIKDQIMSGLNDPSLKQTSGQEDGIGTSGVANDQNVRIDQVDEDSDEEVIELEFERAIGKVHTHTPYCPNCSSRITKVILRRRKKERRDKPVGLFGCLSCFSIFIPSGNCLKTLGIFGSKPKPESKPSVQEKSISDLNLSAAPVAVGSTNTIENRNIKKGSTFDLFWSLGKGSDDQNGHNSQGNDQIKYQGGSVDDETNSTDNSSASLPVSSLHVPLLHGNLSSHHNTASNLTVGFQKPGPSESVVIDIGNGRGAYTQVPRGEAEISGNAHNRGSISINHGSKTLEILKCIVYGGLMEAIASLGVVSSAAASDATTLNIIAIGVAIVISGLIIFGQNLMDLKNDGSIENSNKYQELLGRRGHFLLHSTFAIVSFLIFGLIPPMVYGFTFRESDNKDYKILAVAIASFACIVLLAIAKAYVKTERRFTEYVKTVTYYMTMAISVSGLGYAAGDLFKLLMERVGWFEPSTPATSMMSTGPGWQSY